MMSLKSFLLCLAFSAALLTGCASGGSSASAKKDFLDQNDIAKNFEAGFVEGLEGTIIQRRIDALEKMAQLCGRNNYRITNMDETNEGNMNVGGPEPVGDGMVLVSESVIKFRWEFVCNN